LGAPPPGARGYAVEPARYQIFAENAVNAERQSSRSSTSSPRFAGPVAKVAQSGLLARQVYHGAGKQGLSKQSQRIGDTVRDAQDARLHSTKGVKAI
jgi:hypothetical protein